MLEPRALTTIKLAHTTIWAVIAGSIALLPFLGWAQMYGYVLLINGGVLLETLVLATNGWRCPLTDMAARHTDDRRANFDIYLPLWLARNNKWIFGSLFVLSDAMIVGRWLGWFG